jgi:hypothetical protein
MILYSANAFPHIAHHVGVELQPVVARGSKRVLKDILNLEAPIYISAADIMKLKNLAPTTHVFSFSEAMPPIVLVRILTLCAYSPTVKILAFFAKDAIAFDLVEVMRRECGNVFKQSLSMENSSHQCHVVIMFDSAKAVLKRFLSPDSIERNKTDLTYNYKRFCEHSRRLQEI